MANGKNAGRIRKISEQFLQDLQTGVLETLTKIVKNDAELILCFRDGYINVYYKGHSLFRVEEQPEAYEFTFNLGHARYSGEFERIQADLKILDVTAEAPKGESVRYDAGFLVDKKDGKRWVNIYLHDIASVFKRFVDHFYDPSRTYDYFKKEVDRQKSALLEKRRQQELFTAHTIVEPQGECLLFYDMELQVPCESEKKTNRDNEKDKVKKKSAPDCMAIKLVDGKFASVVLVEVKSTRGACMGDHGIKKHNVDFTAIIGNPSDRKNLYESMQRALKGYEALGIYGHIDTPAYSDDIKFEIRYFFTDEAIDWTENDRQKNENYKTYQKICKEDNEQIVKWPLKDCRITVMRITTYPDLMKQYENPIRHACDLQVGQKFISHKGEKPEGLCDSAWESMRPFVTQLAKGIGNFYDGWMKNPRSAMISCNDGFRPVSFYIEEIENGSV